MTGSPPDSVLVSRLWKPQFWAEPNPMLLASPSLSQASRQASPWSQTDSHAAPPFGTAGLAVGLGRAHRSRAATSQVPFLMAGRGPGSLGKPLPSQEQGCQHPCRSFCPGLAMQELQNEE